VKTGRIQSLDQFRGFTVLAMFVVNFVHGMDNVPRLFHHAENWFSLADWIMPAFLFVVGMSFRLTWPRRVQKSGERAARLGYVKRSLILIGVSLFVFGFGSPIAALLKARLWEVLAIIGASQLLLLPTIGKGTRVRIIAVFVLLLMHAGLSQWFNVHFVLAKPNLLDSLWGAADVRAWDGGFFGLLSWSAIMLAGTVAYDWLAELSPARALRKFVTVGMCGLAVGYAFSCLSTFYDLPERKTQDFPSVAASPVIPSNAPGKLTLAEPPFTPIPSTESRQVNYWMMSKRLVSIPFAVFGIGFVFVILGLFVWRCDLGDSGASVFRILGSNALAAYLIHHILLKFAFAPWLGRDSPLWVVLLVLILFLAVMLGIMHLLDKRKWYLRL
jgi:predicted acyltransferase